MGGVGADCIAALHDAVLNHGIVTDVYVVQNNGILDHTIISDINFLKKYGILYRSVNDGSAGNQTVADLSPRIELGGRKIIDL